MHIDWAALGIVAVVAIASSVVFILLLATGVRLLSVAKVRTNQGVSGTGALSIGYSMIGLAGLLVLLGLYLIIPQFR